jgi:hypothetical protein
MDYEGIKKICVLSCPILNQSIVSRKCVIFQLYSSWKIPLPSFPFIPIAGSKIKTYLTQNSKKEMFPGVIKKEYA